MRDKLILFVVATALLLPLLSACGGGGGGGDTAIVVNQGGADDGGDDPAVLGTLTGIIYDSSGSPIEDADVSVFSILQEGTTNSSGQYSFTGLPRDPHAILISKAGFLDSFQLTDLTDSSLAANFFVLRKSQFPSVPVQAETGYTFTRTSGTYGTATLEISAQGANDFTVGNQTGLSVVDMNLEFINLNEPLPVPLPFSGSQSRPATLQPADIQITGKQAPSVLVSVRPSLLSMAVPATLDLPTPDVSLIGKRILHFDPHTRLWEEVPGAVAGTEFGITEGGIYGVFYEDTDMIGGVNGTVAAGSVVLVGDEVITVSGSHANNVSIPQVHIPASGGLNVQIIDSGGAVSTDFVSPVSGQVSTIGETEGVVIAFDLVDKETGISTDEVSVDKPAEIRISVNSGDGTPLTRRIVTVNSSIGILNPSDGVTLSDENGEATVDLLAGDQTGVGTITVTAEGTTTDPLNFKIGPPDLRIGATIDSTFVEGTLKLGVTGELSSRGTTTVTAELVDSEGDPFTQPVAINFSSNCVQGGEADIDSPVTTVNGTAQAIYQADGCAGEDTITATAAISGQSLTATATLTVAASTIGSIQFVSATPETISLRGTGGTESAEVLFKVSDVNNQPMSGQTVNFSLSTTIGGLSLANTASDISNADGEVRAIVNSGSVPTSVRVVATVEDTDISTVSDAMVVSTGLPDQDSFSISVDIFNPEAWRYDGETVTVNIRAADHFNNPVPDGTAIYFTTEGGRIDPQCNTTEGGCSVTWESQDPRPESSLTDNAGLSTIHAIAIGEEVFNDINGDGRFSSADKANWDANPAFDLPEAFRDDNLSGGYDVGEVFFDFDADGTYSPVNGLFNGTLCTDQGILDGVCTRDLVHVRESIVIAMSDSEAEFEFSDTDGNSIQVVCLRDLSEGDPGYEDVDPADGCHDNVTPGDPDCDDVGKFYVRVADTNDNSMPGGTTVTATSSLGSMLGTSSYTVDNTIAPFYGLFSIQEVCGGVPEAEIEIRVITPKGHETIQSITVLDDG